MSQETQLIIDSISFFLFALVLYFLSVLSKRFGEGIGMKKYYYLYYVGMFFMLLGSITIALTTASSSLSYSLFAFGLTLGLIASVKYWGWVIEEILPSVYNLFNIAFETTLSLFKVLIKIFKPVYNITFGHISAYFEKKSNEKRHMEEMKQEILDKIEEVTKK